MSTTAESIEYHLHDDTLQVRHCFPPTKSLLRYHAEFGPDDTAAGWRQVEAGPADGLSPQDIEQKKAAIAAASRDYWENLLASVPAEQRVVAKGYHYVVHELGVGCGYDGDAFQVTWLDESRPTLVCNLSGQGTVPAWFRARLPDNAVVKHLGRCEDFIARDERQLS